MVKTAPIYVHYPLTEGQLVLRTDADWQVDVTATAVAGTSAFTFDIASTKPFVYFKVCLRQGPDTYWSVGANYLLVVDSVEEKHVYPTFFSSGR